MRKMSLKTKLLTSYLAIVIFFAGVSAITIKGLADIDGLLNSMYTDNLQPIDWVSQANMEAIYQNRSLFDLVTEPDPNEQRKIVASVTDHKKKMDEALGKYRATYLTEKEKSTLQKLDAAWGPYEQAAAETIKASVNHDNKLAQELLQGKATSTFQVVDDLLSDLVAINEKLAEEAKASAANTYGSIRNFAAGATILILLTVCGFGLWFAASLSRAIIDVTERLTSGSGTVASASSQISAAGTELSAAASQQAAALQQTVASVDEISAMVNKNSDNAHQSLAVAHKSQQSTERGKQTVEALISSIEEIKHSNENIRAEIEASNREVADIVNVITDIGAKTKVINEIVFQTKLLSFNASVEAARAGEQGKGFSVVAEEVGNLAQMSGNAAREISEMLEGSISKVEKIVSETQRKVEQLVSQGKQKVEVGAENARLCGEVFDEVVIHAGEVAKMVSEIEQASREQSTGVGEITKAMAQLDQVTQQNASAAQQSSSASEALTQQAAELRHIVSILAETVRGQGTQVDTGTFQLEHRSDSRNGSRAA